MKFNPVRDRVVIKELDGETQTKSGIYIPDTATEKPGQGNVVAVGTGHLLENGNVVTLEVKTGDKVLFGQHSGQTIKVDGEEYRILKEEEILAVIE